MEQIKDDYIVHCMEETGYPPWMQERVPEYDEDDDREEEDELPSGYYTVLNHIERGKQNAIKRSELASVTGLSDRAVRRAVEALRRYYIICNDQDGLGYYRPDSRADVRRYYLQEKARAMAILKRLRPARGLLDWWCSHE